VEVENGRADRCKTERTRELLRRIREAAIPRIARGFVERRRKEGVMKKEEEKSRLPDLRRSAQVTEKHPSAKTLRLYEREGLLKPARSDGNTRLYNDGDLEPWK